MSKQRKQRRSKGKIIYNCSRNNDKTTLINEDSLSSNRDNEKNYGV